MSKGPAPTLGERLRSPLTWHYAAFAVLLAVAIGLCVRLGLDWVATDSHASDVLVTKQVQLAALNLQVAPLRGLDKSVAKTREQLKSFLDERIPANYSAIETSMSDLEVKTGVRLSRVQYSQGKPGQDVTPITMDAAISGDYPSIMHFVNGLERAKTFYLIDEMALAGEQNGLVNLRIRVTTWLRPDAAEASGLPMTAADEQRAADSSNAGAEEE
jgi:Tfp pilus assembly protein PilO